MGMNFRHQTGKCVVMGSINVTGICIRRDLHKAELTYCELIHVDRLLSY